MLCRVVTVCGEVQGCGQCGCGGGAAGGASAGVLLRASDWSLVGVSSGTGVGIVAPFCVTESTNGEAARRGLAQVTDCQFFLAFLSVRFDPCPGHRPQVRSCVKWSLSDSLQNLLL